MSRLTRIKKNPDMFNHYLVDTDFLVNKYVDPSMLAEEHRQSCRDAKPWWDEISRQLLTGKARVYVLNISIAEAFKVFSRIRFEMGRINSGIYGSLRERLKADMVLDPVEARKSIRKIKYHDIQINRDIIIGIDRFFEQASLIRPSVSTVDLLILSAAKYLMDFYSMNSENLFIITQDRGLFRVGTRIADLPAVFCPDNRLYRVRNIFV